MRAMLSTSDNPFNPFTQYELWESFDVSKGYHSASYLDRVANVSSNLGPDYIDYEIEAAIDEIVDFNKDGIILEDGSRVYYIKVYE